MKSFADIPAEVQRRIEVGERVILILLDAFGLEFLERHRDHPFIQRLDVTPLRSRFPSTTTAHVSSVHFGVPVHEHGLYEWNILEPDALRGVTVLITADHVQVAVGPDRVDYLDDVWPELPTLLSQPRPAGSSRDVFLHVHAEHVLTVIHELSARLEGPTRALG